MHCPRCNSFRPGDTCWKCGTATHEPCEGWEYPTTPPVDRIRELARQVGYAIGEHGSKERDLDLIAAPWTADAIGNHDLLVHLARGLGARFLSLEVKPLGRYAATLQMDGYFKPIYISVAPRVGIIPTEAPVEDPHGHPSPEEHPAGRGLV